MNGWSVTSWIIGKMGGEGKNVLFYVIRWRRKGGFRILFLRVLSRFCCIRFKRKIEIEILFIFFVLDF